MSVRKQTVKDASGFDGNTQEEDDKDEFSLSLLPPALTRDKRRREGENKSKPIEMTEEEMMDLALRLSEQEASVTASRLQQEEEAVMKAIQESMVGQTQACPPSQNQSLLTDAEASLRLCSRRKLMYSNGRKTSAINQGVLEDECPPETDMNQEAKETGDKYNNQNKKRKRKEGSPLPEMPDLSQSQKIYSQASPCSSDSLSAPLDSQQSSDSTLIDDCQLHKSPVFPLTDCRATVCVPRLSQDLLETCKTSGFVLCSQDSWISTQKSQPKSLTFPKSPSYFTACPKSPVFSETDQGDDVETELNPECDQSPVFGNSGQKETSPSACKPQVCENSGFMFSSQESLTSTVRSTSCRPKSPVFPSSPGLPKNITFLEKSAICYTPVFPESNRGQTGESHRCSSSPVFGKTRQEQKIHPDTKNPSMVPSAAELRGSNCELNSSTTWDPPQSPRQEGHSQDVRFTTSSKSEADKELNEISKDCSSAETKLTSDMTLIWSDEDDDNITPVGSPSPVFPEERSIHQADSQAASSNHVTAASPDTTVSNCRKQLCTTEQKTQLVGSPGTANGALTPCGEPTGASTVHYYWGVPFCPRGLDPDSYTQMILAQMEVYEKSLKEAQRSLLRKAEWGEPILPQPEKSPSPESQAESPEPHIPRRLGLRLRGKNQRETGDNSPAEAEEEEEDKKAKEEEKETETENKEEEKNEGGEDEENTDDCEVCPETQLSDDNNGTQDLTMSPNDRAQLQPESPELPEVEMILQDGSPAVDQKQVEEEMDVDVPEDRKTESSISVCRSVGGQNVRKQEIEEDSEDPDVEEVKDPEPQRSASPEPKLAAIPRSPENNIDCPICQGSFPVTEIEIHAAYCDGEVAVVHERRPEANSFQTSLKPRRKRTRRADVTGEDTNKQSLTGRSQEKCYVCQKAVPLKDYSHHTEFCIQRQASKTDTKGNLLSALEQTESMDSVAGPSKLQPGEVIDLRDEDEDDDGVSAFRISNSPIRSFTPISEATDCLIDFKKQQRAKKPSRRRR